ncbi:YggS family pyridoxal phosphate-dependent enzyme [Wenxinia saemankumensis]|uniref:Pyridoxal phosphate homeostasis protein n=1 Tax=Wenxinia saemankumensis TaxID=1447782 RepID=A0A1M6FWV5_9RHOB|nr:YggS family pyridoxal phosphate-dependent enzyme [Wenxinia saemankumensis]SHJ02157.1 hypothetical protein SAMN05444417_2546 [Wenxinia saemankumensis]
MGLNEIAQRVRQAAERAGRAPAEVTLIAVSKVQPEERIDSVLGQGQRVFGENRVQEAQGRWSARRDVHPDLELHLIGPLQTNKARAAIELFDAIHSVDRPKLVDTLARLRDETGACPRLFVQVNTGAEPQKAGILAADAPALVERARGLDLPVEGLMCIPPADEAAEPHFARLAALAADLGLPGLSMGMSADFEAAIAHGATHVRVGSAIFGERQPG